MNELSEWLTLYHVTGIGPATYTRLLEQFDSPGDVLACKDTSLLKHCGLSASTIQAIKQPNLHAVERDLNWLSKGEDHHIVSLNNPNYPQLLKEIPSDPPPILYLKGSLHLVEKPQIAIVGSRNPSPSGRENALHFAKALSQQGLTVTSGLALGIDAASHQGALATQSPTLAVCATGLDSIYPKRHEKLAQSILEKQGLLLSEFPIGTPPKKENFPRRNRIISGLSLGTLVIEAALRSGSLITARYALEQNREVFALPGSIHNPLAKGCHSLIKQGAKLIETVEDIVEELNIKPHPTKENSQIFQETIFEPINLAGNQLAVFQEIGHEPTSTDAVVQRSGLTADVVSSILMELELQRYITSTPGGYYSRKR